MSTDLRTEINAADSATGWTSDGPTPAANTTAGQRYEGSASIDTQHDDADEHTKWTDATARDVSDETVYVLVKDNLLETFANRGMQIVLGDGTDLIGYRVGGNDAPGLPLKPFFNGYKLDVSVIVAAPGTDDVDFHTYSGSEANNDHTAITQFGYGTDHLAKAVGTVDNIFMDRMTRIANGSYALRINGGTVGTPETMADVQGDDVTNGWGMIANPLGSQFIFFAPTEWGEPAANADHFFEADGEQWFWLGDNAGGHTVGDTHFPFRVVGNATDTGSWVISNTSIVNTGTRAQFLMDDANIDTLEVDSCSFTGLGTIGCPSSGGTSRFCTNTIFSDCDQVTHNGADMSGSSILLSNVAADEGALFYDETADPDGEMDNMSFSKGGNAHHAIRFGANVPASITLRGLDFVGFGAADDANDSVFLFDDVAGNITLNLIGCTHDGSGFTVDDAAGVTVTVVIDPVDVTVTILDGRDNSDLQNARVILEAADGTGDLPFEDSVTITRSGATASVSHTGHGLVNGNKVVIRGADQAEYNGVKTISNVTTNAYDYTVSGTPTTPATGTIISTGVVLEGLTDVNGEITDTRTWTLTQPVVGVARKATTTPIFKDAQLTGSISPTTGLTITQALTFDE